MLIYDLLIICSPVAFVFVFSWWRNSRFKPLAKSIDKAAFFSGGNGRNFTDEEREIIWIRANKRCEVCGRKTRLRKSDPDKSFFGYEIRLANAHHPVPDYFNFHASIEFGMNLCQKCNIGLSNKITYWSVRAMKKLWCTGRPYKIWIDEKDKNLWKPKLKRI